VLLNSEQNSELKIVDKTHSMTVNDFGLCDSDVVAQIKYV